MAECKKRTVGYVVLFGGMILDKAMVEPLEDGAALVYGSQIEAHTAIKKDVLADGENKKEDYTIIRLETADG